MIFIILSYFNLEAKRKAMDNKSTLYYDIAPNGPYRATKLWNDVIHAVRTGIPLGRHRRYMKTYDHCFVASAALDWLHGHLKMNPNFGPAVTRCQTLQLMQKLYKAKIFEDVRGDKRKRSEFADNARLYRFTYSSPIKSKGRVPFSSKTNLLNSSCSDVSSKTDKTESKKTPPCRSSLFSDTKQEPISLTADDISDIWKHHTLESLKQLLDVKNLDDLLDEKFINGKNIMHNCLYINKSGIVTNIEPQDRLPHWALSAMKCLAHWPKKVDDNLPDYSGFERDVFGVVKDYFNNLSEPLMTYEMYEVVTNVYAKLNTIDNHNMSSDPSLVTSTKQLNFASVENLLKDLTFNNGIRHADSSPNLYVGTDHMSSFSTVNLSSFQPLAESSNIYGIRRYGSVVNIPVARFETCFGPENRATTSVYYSDGVSPIYPKDGHDDSLYHTPLETNFDLSSDGQCYSTPSEYSVNYAHVKPLETSINKSASRSEDNKLNVSSVTVKSKPGTPHVCRRKSKKYAFRERRSGTPHVKGQGNASFSHNECEKRTPHVKRQGNTSFSQNEGENQEPHFRLNVPKDLPPYKPPPPYRCMYDAYHYKPTSVSTNLKKSKSSASLNKVGSRKLLNQLKNRNTSSSVTSDANSMASRSFSLSDLRKGPKANGAEQEPLSRVESSPCLSLQDRTEIIKKFLQLICLMIPPANLRRLQLLVRLMYRLSHNKEICLDSSQSTKKLVLDTFHRSILCSHEEADMDEFLIMKIVNLIIDCHNEILTAPQSIKDKVDATIQEYKNQKIFYSLGDASSSSYSYCKQVSLQEFESQKKDHSEQAVCSLLEGILQNKSMSDKDKKKRLKQFQKTYPEIYARRFANQENIPENPNQMKPPKIRQPLLVKHLHKIKGLR